MLGEWLDDIISDDVREEVRYMVHSLWRWRFQLYQSFCRYQPKLIIFRSNAVGSKLRDSSPSLQGHWLPSHQRNRSRACIEPHREAPRFFVILLKKKLKDWLSKYLHSFQLIWWKDIDLTWKKIALNMYAHLIRKEHKEHEFCDICMRLFWAIEEL